MNTEECSLTLLNRFKFNLNFLNRHKHLIAVVMRRVEISEESMTVDMALLHEFMQDYASDCLTPCSISIEIPQNYFSASSNKSITIKFIDNGSSATGVDLNNEEIKALFTIIDKMLQLCAVKFLKH
jgi:hypothetical protein